MVKGVEDGVEQAHGRYRLQALIALSGGSSRLRRKYQARRYGPYLRPGVLWHGFPFGP